MKILDNKMSNNPTKDQQRAEILANQKSIKLTTQEEFRAIRLRQFLFRGYTFHLAPLLSDFLKEKRKLWINNHKLDTDVLLNIMIDQFEKDPLFFPTFMENTEAVLEKALLGCRAVAHCFHPMLLQEGKQFLSSWISVCLLLAHPKEAEKLQMMFNHVFAGKPDLRGNRGDNYYTPEFVQLSSTPRVMSFTDFEKSLLVQVYMMKADAEAFGPALRQHLVSEPGGAAYRNNVMDTQSYLMDLIERHKLRPNSPKNARILRRLYRAKDTMDMLMHGEIIPLLDRNDDYFRSWIKVCEILKLSEASSQILDTKHQLANILSRY